MNISKITPTSTPNIISGALYEREHQGQIGVRSGSDDDSDGNGDNHYDDDYDDDAYTDTKAVLMMLLAIMIVGMNDGVNIEGSRNPEFASISPVACNFPYP